MIKSFLKKWWKGICYKADEISSLKDEIDSLEKDISILLKEKASNETSLIASNMIIDSMRDKIKELNALLAKNSLLIKFDSEQFAEFINKVEDGDKNER